MRFFGVKWHYNKIYLVAEMIFVCFNNIKTRLLKNRASEKCLISYHPEQRHFDQTDMRFLYSSISWMFFGAKILRFTYFFNLDHVWKSLRKYYDKRNPQYRHNFKFKLKPMVVNTVTVLTDGRHTFTIRIKRLTFSFIRVQYYKPIAVINHNKLLQ
jgi:hypothetical protein